jgi:hypothetical protein
MILGTVQLLDIGADLLNHPLRLGGFGFDIAAYLLEQFFDGELSIRGAREEGGRGRTFVACSSARLCARHPEW